MSMHPTIEKKESKQALSGFNKTFSMISWTIMRKVRSLIYDGRLRVFLVSLVATSIAQGSDIHIGQTILDPFTPVQSETFKSQTFHQN